MLFSGAPLPRSPLSGSRAASGSDDNRGDDDGNDGNAADRDDDDDDCMACAVPVPLFASFVLEGVQFLRAFLIRFGYVSVAIHN